MLDYFAPKKYYMLLDRGATVPLVVRFELKSRIALSQRDFAALTGSLDLAFVPNTSLQKAPQDARSVGRA